MAIILPAHCKGVTAGALKQIKQQGFTTAGNSSCAFSKSYLDGLIANPKGYTRHSEPPPGTWELAVTPRKDEGHQSTSLTESCLPKTRQLCATFAQGG